MDQARLAFSAATALFQQVSMVLVTGSAVVAFVTTGLAAFGFLPWLELPLSYADAPVEGAGMIAQVGLTVFLTSICFLVPTSYRIMKLEHAHHAFSIRMEDVARAYAVVHADDRKGLFQCQSEFDAVKERINHLRAHPDLGSLEPDILEIAAQMSRVSEELAEAYSDERVDRAYDFLRQREAEFTVFQDRVNHAKAIHADIRLWANKIELDESVARSQLNQLIEELNTVLPEIEVREAKLTKENGIIPMHKPSKS